jgi:hypothetical protein
MVRHLRILSGFTALTDMIPDLWQLPDQKRTNTLATRVEANFYARVPPAERPAYLRDFGSTVAAADVDGSVTDKGHDVDEKDPERGLDTPDPKKDHARKPPFQRRPTGTTPMHKGEPKYDKSLLRALHASFWPRFWATGAAKLTFDTLNTTTPLVNKLLLTWLTEIYVFHRLPEEDRSLYPVSSFVCPDIIFLMSCRVNLLAVSATVSGSPSPSSPCRRLPVSYVCHGFPFATLPDHSQIRNHYMFSESLVGP